MHSPWKHRFCIRLILVVAALMAGCSHPPGRLADAGVSVDAGQDASTQAPPQRSLARRGLFGQTPVQNRFFDPTFSQIDGFAWSPFLPTSYDPSVVTRVYQRTPQGQPAVRLERAPGQSTGQLTGMAKGAPGPMEISVWLGRFVGSNVADLSVVLYGLFMGGSSAVVLDPDAAVAPVVMDGVNWVFYSGYLADGPVSWAYFRISNKDVAPLFITAPVFTTVTAQTRRLRARTPAVHRPLLPVEGATWRDWRRRVLERFGGAPRPFVL